MKSIAILFLLQLISNSARAVQVGSINGVSFTGAPSSSITISGSCDQCVCVMLTSNLSFASLNCYQNNGTCSLFYDYYSQNLSYRMQDASQTTFFFLVLPPDPPSGLYWPFDGSVNEVDDRMSAVSSSSISFVSPGIYGLGSTAYFNGSQYINMSSTSFSVSSNSFTFEMWIYVTDSSSCSSGRCGMLGYCQSNRGDGCLHLEIRSFSAYFGFYSDDCPGGTTLSSKTWYHLAFVYDVTTKNQFIYVNGNLDCSRTANPLNMTDTVPLVVGADMFVGSPPAYNFFIGYIDQLSYVNRAKNSSEVRDDVFLLASFSFNQGSLLDSGRYQLNGIANQVTSVGNAISFNQTSSSFQIQTFDLTGVFGTSFSITLWLNPLSTNGSTIVHNVGNSSTNNSFCYDLLGFNKHGYLIAQIISNETVYIVGPSISTNAWTFIVQTFSPANGVRLYTNGTLKNGTGPITSSSSRQTQTITLGNCLENCQSCSTGLIVSEPYVGSIDEFRIYSRELNATDIQSLMNR